jgi:hypothetical protein
MGTLSWTDYKDLILSGYNNALSWTKNPGYTTNTKIIEWHIQISDHKFETFYITSSQGPPVSGLLVE